MLFYVTAIVLLASAQAKFYTDCGSKLASIEKVGVSGCAEDAKECILKRNSNVSISLDFTPSVDVKGLETEVHGVIMNLPVPFPLPQPDACKNNGLTCPLKGNDANLIKSLWKMINSRKMFKITTRWGNPPKKAGQKVSYVATLPVLKSYPRVKVDVKWELKNDDGDDLVCILIPAKIN